VCGGFFDACVCQDTGDMMLEACVPAPHLDFFCSGCNLYLGWWGSVYHSFAAEAFGLKISMHEGYVLGFFGLRCFDSRFVELSVRFVFFF